VTVFIHPSVPARATLEQMGWPDVYEAEVCSVS
jgi:hypothetical protein